MGSTCIFEYMSTPSFGCAGMPGGYSICVFKSGDVVQREYVFGDKEPKAEVILATMPELAKTIQTIVSSHSDDLKFIPNNLDNGTLDGSYNCFKFGGKRISAWTIQRTDLEEIHRRNPRYYEAYKENMIFENLVLDIYDEIAAEITM